MRIDKAQVAQRFARAHQSYKTHAVVQQQICQQLMAKMQQYIVQQKLSDQSQLRFENVLEIGCGSGNLTDLLLREFQIQHLTLNDLYAEVLQAYLHNPQSTSTQIHGLIGDIEQLDFPQSLDLICSSSALQWVEDFGALLRKANQALKPQGYLCFSTFGPQNLTEIKQLTGQGLHYLSMDALQQQLKQHGFEVLHCSEQLESLSFEHPKQILQHLKATGVTGTAQGQRWNKTTLTEFYRGYEQFSQQHSSQQKSYTLTYHPIYCLARRMP